MSDVLTGEGLNSGEGGEGGEGGGAPEGASGEGGGGAPALGVADTKLDISSFPEPIQTALNAKKIDTVGGVLDIYTSMEKLVGADVIAKPGEGQYDEWLGENKALAGVPEEADGYKMPEVELPEGMKLDEDAIKAGQALAHEHNLTPKQFEGFAKLMAQDRINQHNAAIESRKAEDAKLDQELRKDWGQEYDANLEAAKAWARHRGYSKEIIDALDKGMGSAVMLKEFAELGKMNAKEGGGIELGEGGGPGGQATAVARRAELQGDEAFMKRLHNKQDPRHQEAVDEWQRVHAEMEGESAT